MDRVENDHASGQSQQAMRQVTRAEGPCRNQKDSIEPQGKFERNEGAVGNLVEEIEGKSYGFGLNLADIWKRSFTQILNKGIVLEHWGHKVYWVVQEPVYQNLVDRYSLNEMDYRDEDRTVFRIYDLQADPEKGQYRLRHTRTESSSIDHLFDAFRNNPNIPSKDEFVHKLGDKIRTKAALKLKFQQAKKK